MTQGYQTNDIFKAIDQALKNFEGANSKFNILIAGKAGVGKSTLINSIFREEIAPTEVVRYNAMV